MNSTDIENIASGYADMYWSHVASRQQLLPGLPASVLLHAGPPFGRAPFGGALPAPVRHAAVQALLYEGLAADEHDAAEALAQGRVQLRPAQDYGVVTPLAQVVSASVPMAVVSCGGLRRYAPLVEAGVPALRFGAPPADARARLRLLDLFARAVLAPRLAGDPLPLRPVVHAGLQAGQECHALTDAANRALARGLHLAPRDSAVVQAYGGFVLPILMAACSLRLEAGGGTLVAAGGNGLHFGYRERGARQWQTLPAEPPRGTRLAGHEQTPALGAIGDSAVVDFAGLGAQALCHCPDLAREWSAWLPADLAAHRRQVLDGATGTVSLAALRHHGQVPLVNLAILDLQGRHGLIGRGVYQPGLELFA